MPKMTGRDQTKSITTITVDRATIKAAHDAGLCVSHICEAALKAAVNKKGDISLIHNE